MLPQALLEFSQSFLSSAFDCEGVRAPNPAKALEAEEVAKEIASARGRPLIYPMVPSGRGSGPFVELVDGSVKMDLICGIGVHLFGHGHPELILAGLKGALQATTMQGTLMPGREYGKLLRLLIDGASKLEHLDDQARAKISGGWLTTCGTMANELALKILRQKKSPAFKLITFKNAFAGRSTTMQELTDEPKYREGQPIFHQFAHIPFYDSKKSLSQNVSDTKGEIDKILAAEGEVYCGFGVEIVQGEGGGFRSAPREWWLEILGHLKQKGLGIWFDEVQTFGRTGELFAFQRWGLGEFVDVVSCAKPLQAAAVLWTKEYEPRPGLIAGTFAGGTVSLSLGIKIVEMLVRGNYLGPQGRIRKLEDFIRSDWEMRRERLKDILPVGESQITGGMIAFEVLDGKADKIKKFLDFLFQKGIVAFSAGRDPVVVRFLPPMGVLTEEHWLSAMEIFESSLIEFHKRPKEKVESKTNVSDSRS